ncbi:7TM diverse intracellular signaling domain-containing protein [Arcobacter sp.]|uniref:7TM diverse intracellular signaling domain-containing protein n=1 Tax=Arcobacter sp. TaxID=1872629 RepID=UPI003D0ACD4B
MKYIHILFFLFFNTFIYANPLVINEDIKSIDLLSHSEIYIDKSRSISFEEIKKSEKLFQKNDKKLLSFGYSPNFDVWIKFTLKNNSNKAIEKIVEYNNSLTTEIIFYDDSSKKIEKEGLLNINKNRKSLTPIFKINIQANDTKTYYMKVSSIVTTLIVKLKIWDSSAFYEKEIVHQFVLALFFGAMLILTIYNLFIYFFTKDISYLYYVLYIFGIILHHTLYVGVAFIYLFKQEWIIYIVHSASLFVSLPIIALSLFTKSFLQISKYKILDKILSAFLILYFISILFFILTDEYNKYRSIIPFMLLSYLIALSVYSAFKKNRQAYFILVGWFMIFIAITFMFLSSGGVFNIYKYFPYFVETSLILEGIVFSIALADRINSLQKEKQEVNQKLIIQQENEKQKLELLVNEKTNNLKVALDEKGLLLKELNHRVKNNMQTIVSLIRLQSDGIEDDKYKDILETIQNRINAMGHLHELLYNQNDISDINAYEYFEMLIEEIKDSYESDIEIVFDIKTRLKVEHAIYCGLILNELMTNSFKYAFPNKKGQINVKLYKENHKIKLIFSDNGVGYIQEKNSNSLGLILIDTLTRKQLKGEIIIKSDNGVIVNINWNENETQSFNS